MTRISLGPALVLIIVAILLVCIPGSLGSDTCPCPQDSCPCDDTYGIPVDCVCPFGWNESDISPTCACPFGWNKTDVNPACVCPFGWNESDYPSCCSCPFGPTCGSGKTIFQGELNAGFSANVTSGAAPLTVKFSQYSTGDPTTWEWDFGDEQTSSLSSPVHTYTSPGSYTVTLTVSRGYSPGKNTQMVETRTVSQPGYIKVTGYVPVQSSDQPASEQKISGEEAFLMMTKMEQRITNSIAKNQPTILNQLQPSMIPIPPAPEIPNPVISGKNPAGTGNKTASVNGLLAITKGSKKPVSFPEYF